MGLEMPAVIEQSLVRSHTTDETGLGKPLSCVLPRDTSRFATTDHCSDMNLSRERSQNALAVVVPLVCFGEPYPGLHPVASASPSGGGCGVLLGSVVTVV